MLLTTTSKINAIKEFMKAGDYDSAVEIAEKVNPERVNSVRDLMTIANAYLKKHRYEDAKVVYVEMHNHATTHKVMVGLIELCLKTNCPEEAEVYIREFRKLEPTNPERLIYRYRVDVMLGKGQEYLVKSLSKLKDEDYSDVWGLELAKTYYKMDDYQKCAQECKDLLLWFSGTEAAAKAHILLSACIEKGAKITMPEVKPHKDEDFDMESEQEPMDVPTIAPEAKKEDSDDGLFFDVSAVIDELGSDTQGESAANANEVQADAAETVEEYDSEDMFFEEGSVSDQSESSATKEDSFEEDTSAKQETDDISEDVATDVAYNEVSDEAIPEDATELLSFLSNYSDEEIGEALREAENSLPEDATVPIFLPKEGEEKKETNEDSYDDVELDLIGLAVKKAKEADDDDDDIVIRDYFPKDILAKDSAEQPKKESKAEVEQDQKLSLSESFEQALSAEEEDDDGQMSFFGAMKEEDDVRLPFGKNDEEESFDDLAASIARAVEEDIENGTTEDDSVSKEPTKVHSDITAEALHAMLRDDDDAVEKALYELLSDK